MVIGNRIHERLGRWFVVALNITGMSIIVMPLVLIFWLSFLSNEVLSLPAEGYSLKWFGEVWAQPQFAEGFYLSFLVACIATISGLLVSVPASLALVRSSFPGREAIIQFLMSPLIVPAIVIGASLYMASVEVEILTGLPLSGTMAGFIIGHILLTIPWCFRLFTANLTGLNASMEEAALSLGATPLAVVRKVTLPLIKPGVIAAAIFSFVVSFGNLEISLFLAAPGQTTLPVAILQYLQWKIDPTIAAVSVLQVLIVGSALILSNRFVNLSKVV